MSKRLQVLEAVKALIVAALPNAAVVGLDSEDEKPDAIPAGGLVAVYAGDPGEPEVDLSPVRYYYDHAIPIEVGAYTSASLTSEQVLDAMLGAIGAAVKADHTLGGLCDLLEARAPATDDFDAEGAVAGRWGAAEIVASYSTSDPLN
jgi:hypothetical protein